MILHMEKHDLIRNAAIGASAAIPIVGGPLSVLLDKLIPSNLERQYEELVNNLSREIEDLHYQIDGALVETPEFISLCAKVLNRILCEFQKEKVTAYRNMLFHALVGQHALNMDDYFLQLTSVLSVDQFKFLCVMKALADQGHKTPGLSDVMKLAPNIDRFYLTAEFTALLRYGLIDGKQISNLGIKYIEQVNSPSPLFCF